MVAPYGHRIAIELQHEAINAVVAEVNQRSCQITDCYSVEIVRNGSNGDNNSDPLVDAMKHLKGRLPNTTDTLSASVIVPPDRVIETSLQIPISSHIDKYEWENWEITMLMADREENYLYESYHLETSPCRNFNVRMITAVRRSFVDRLLATASKAGFSVDQICFPQQLWKQILASAYPEDTSRIDCLYICNGSANLIAMEPGGPAQMSVTEFSDGEDEHLPETVETFLSWYGRNPRSASVRAFVDSARKYHQIDQLASKMAFLPIDLRRLPNNLISSVGDPERYLLPLSALGLV